VALPAAAATPATPRAAVTFVDAGDQPRSKLRSLRALVEGELEQHEIKVVRKPAPPLVSPGARALGSYARARRLDRVYDVRLRAEGRRLVVTLTERKAPAMRSTFSARLAAESADRVDAIIPRLVGAVVARKEPEPEPQQQPKVAALTSPSEAPAPSAAVAATAAPPQRRGEFLIGASVDLGSYLHSAAGLYGGAVKLFYQYSQPLRFGLEVGGQGGGGAAFRVGTRADWLFSASGLSPIAGAGLGYVALRNGQQGEGGGGYFSASGGVEYARLRHVRLVGEVEVLLPFFKATRHDIVSDNGIISMVPTSAWSPSALVKLGCLY
jgi:hypothetical protein